MAQAGIRIKALNPVYKMYIKTIIDTISTLEGVCHVKLENEDLYAFEFSIGYDVASDYPYLMEQIKTLLTLYGSVILALSKS